MSNLLKPQWEWWLSNDGGECFHDGPFPDRETAAASADPGDLVAECLPNHINLAKFFDARDWLERTRDSMDDEDGPDENGDHPLDRLTDEQIDSLQITVRAAIAEWQQRHALPLRTYWFSHTYHEDHLTFDDICEARRALTRRHKETQADG